VAAEPAFNLDPYDYAEALAIERELGVAEPVAAVLVRRGFHTPEAARAFLECDEVHDPFLLGPMREISERIRAAARAGRRITVHGDYDVDGVCATSILVGALVELGADCDWYVPDRLGDGYGLSAGSIERIAGRGGDLIVTVDCGIGSAAAVESAQAAGLEVIVTDHHEPPESLPECSILHPRLGDYPFGELCGAGVALKLASALAGPEYAERSLDLAAFATVADMVPLVGENRTLVRRGLAVARRGLRPGMRALCLESGVDPVRLDEGDFAFRLGPRINAAGRLYRADAAIELMLSAGEERAAAIAAELSEANAERRETERAVLDAAETARRALDPEFAEGPALVLAGEGWHPGVVGIVASRMVERHGVPAVLIGLEDGRGRGSARSVPGFDLLAGLDSCAAHLVRYGGHRAAAGLEIQASSVEAFRRAFCDCVIATLGPEPATRGETIDAIVGGESLGLDVARQLGRLAPFGMGNPEVHLLVPSARLADVRSMGEGERHARFTLASGSRRALGVAFGVNGSLEAAADDTPRDVSLRLEVNEWNGAVEPRVVLGKLYELPASQNDGDGPEAQAGLGDAEWWGRFEAELALPLDPPAAPAAAQDLREVVDRRGGSGVAAVAGLASSGGPLLVLACDALRRRALVELAARPAAFGGGELALASRRLPSATVDGAVGRVLAAAHGIVLADWDALADRPALAADFAHVLAIDPPPSAHHEAAATAARPGGQAGFFHLAWGPAEVALARRVQEGDWPSDAVLRAVFRVLRAASEGDAVGAEKLRDALGGPGPFSRSPEAAARCLRVLFELGLVQETGTPGDRALRVVSSESTELDRSAAFVAYRARSEEGIRYLSRREQAS